MHCRLHKELLSQHKPFKEENKLNSRARFKRQNDQKITDAVHLLKVVFSQWMKSTKEKAAQFPWQILTITVS